MPNSSLMAAFVKAVGIYLLPIPFSRKDFLKDLGKKLIFAVCAQQVLHGGLGLLLYPSIEDTFKEIGIEDSILKKLNVPSFAFVRPAPQDRNLIDHLYAITDMPTIVGVIHSLQRSFGYSGGLALPYPVCDISLPNETGYAKAFAASSLHVPIDNITSDIISDKDALALILAHEMGHCDWGMHIPLFLGHAWDSAVKADFSMFIDKQFWQAELYSDQVAMHFAAQIEDQERSKNMLRYMLSTRAGQQYYIWNHETGYAYDYAMVLASNMGGEVTPRFENIVSAREELAKYTTENITYKTADEYIHALLQTVQAFLIDDSIEKSHFSTMRAELYIDAIEYLAPHYITPQVVASLDYGENELTPPSLP